jgi:hypothetical protein
MEFPLDWESELDWCVCQVYRIVCSLQNKVVNHAWNPRLKQPVTLVQSDVLALQQLSTVVFHPIFCRLDLLLSPHDGSEE